MKYKEKNFFIENIKVSTLAKKYHTPIYCYSYDKLKKILIILKKNLRQ